MPRKPSDNAALAPEQPAEVVLVPFSVILPNGEARTVMARDEADKDRRVAAILRTEFTQ